MHPLHLLFLGALIASASVSATPAPAVGSPNPAGEPLSLGGACGPEDYGPWPWLCSFTALVSDPYLVVFRWDFEGDGIWDFGWVDVLSLYHSYTRNGVMRVTLQGWDGYSSSNGEPVGPKAYMDLVLGDTLELGPAAWNRSSRGWMSAIWEYPRGFQPPAGSPETAMVGGSNGVPAIPLPRSPHPRLEPVGVAFRVDRALLTQLLGPGTHRVWIWGHWGSYEFLSPLTNVTLP